MPRKSKRTLSGAPASPPRMPVDTTYGEGERALESQRRTPVPAGAGGPAPVVTPGAGGGAAGGGGNDATGRFAQAIQAATGGMSMPDTPFGAPSQRPLEPIQTGMAGGESQVAPPPVTSDVLYELRALVQRDPNPDMLRLLASVEQEL